MSIWESLLEGFASIGEGIVALFDLAGVCHDSRIEKIFELTDVEALESDWEAIANDMRKVLNDLEGNT